jgi:uncharacterized repeat protein (TIGR04138 family)
VPRSIAPEVPPLVRLLKEDRRYKLEAYNFVRAGLAYAQEVLKLGQVRATDRGRRGQVAKHVSGRDLCLALKQLAHEQYGLMSRLVLANWGIQSTSDFGEIVFNLIRIGEMSLSAEDRREDFDNVYDFDTALERDYVIVAATE